MLRHRLRRIHAASEHDAASRQVRIAHFLCDTSSATIRCITTRVPFRFRVDTGGGWPPAIPLGTATEIWQTFRDYNNFADGNPKRVTVNTFSKVSDTHLHELAQIYIGSAEVGERDRDHVFEDGFWKIKTWNWADDYDWPYSYEEQWLKMGTFKPVFDLHRDGTLEKLYYAAGWWDSANEQFSDDSRTPDIGCLKMSAFSVRTTRE